MAHTTFSGPSANFIDVRDALERAGYVVHQIARRMGLIPYDPGDEFLSIEGQHPDAVEAIIRSLGWRHRATVGDPMPVMPVMPVLRAGGDR